MSVQSLEVTVVLDVLDFLAVVAAVVRVMFLVHLHLVHAIFLLQLHLVQLFTNIIIWKFTQPRFVGILLSVLAVSLPFCPCSLHGTNHFLFLLPREEGLVASPLPVPRPHLAKAAGL